MEHSLCDKYGFDAKQRKQYSQLMGLTAGDHVLIKNLHEKIIQKYAKMIVQKFYKKLLSFPEIKKFLNKHAKIEDLKATQLLYLKSYGLNFDSAEYFEQRLLVGQVHAQIKLPLPYYKMAFRILDEVLLDYIAETIPREHDIFLPMIKLISRISTLDMSLAIETYHNIKVQGMSKSINALQNEKQSLSCIIERDELTKVASRSKLLEYLNLNIETSFDENDTFCVAMIDLDYFKAVNDNYGHLIGDKILIAVASRMKQGLRESDMLGRYGGEEFVLIFPHEKIDSAEKILNRICDAIASEPFMVEQHSIPITISIGVTDYHKNDSDEDILDRADHALYKAKKAGRNRVVIIIRK